MRGFPVFSAKQIVFFDFLVYLEKFRFLFFYFCGSTRLDIAPVFHRNVSITLGINVGLRNKKRSIPFLFFIDRFVQFFFFLFLFSHHFHIFCILFGDLQNGCYVQSGATTKIKKNKKKQSNMWVSPCFWKKIRIFDCYFLLLTLKKSGFCFFLILVVAPDWTQHPLCRSPRVQDACPQRRPSWFC